MSLLTQQTNVNANLFYFLKGNGKQLNVSSLNADFISTGTLAVGGNASVQGNLGCFGDFFADNVSTNNVSTNFIYADGGTISTLSTFEIVIDSQTLNATPTELLLNGIPLATTSNLSSISEWSYDPAISTVQMDGNDLNQAGTVSSLNVRAGNGFFTNLIAFNSLFVSTATSTISSMLSYGDVGTYSTLNTNLLSTNQVMTSSIGAQGGTLSTLNVGAGGNVLLENFGVSFAGVGSAQLGFEWFYQDDKQTDFFYDTNISSVRVMTRNPGGYTDAVASRLHVPEAGISSLSVSSLTTTDLIVSSNLQVSGYVSTPNLYVSSINGAEFTSTTLTIQVAGVSSLFANSISSIGAELRTALVSTLQFNPSFSPSLGGVNVNLGLGSILGNVIGWGAGVFGAAAGTVGLVTGMAALANGRQDNYIDNTKYELVNGTTQLQFSTLGTATSTFYRATNSAIPDQIAADEIIFSTILPAGTLAVRSVSDPLNTVSTPNSTIQAFGQWAAVPPELTTSTFTQLTTSSLTASTIETLYANVSSVVGLSSINGVSISQYENVSSIDWAFYPAVSTINFSTGVTAVVAASAGSDIALTGASVKLIGGYTDAYNLLLASTISTAVVAGASDNIFFPTGGPGFAPGLKIDAPNIFLSTTQTNITGFTNASTVGANRTYGRLGEFSSLTVSSITQTGLSSITYTTAPAAGAQAQPAGRLLIGGNDVDFGQQDIWCQQIRLGAGNATNAQTEIIFYDAAAGQRGLQTALQDRTIRVVSTINANQGGYLLDTNINPPFFSTINQSTALMAFFPSSINSTIGVSTLSFIPPLTVAGSWYSSTSQTVAGANTETPLTYNSESVNVGGFTYAGSTITIPSGGLYEITHSIQFDTTSGGTNNTYFWLKKNGANIPQSASIVSIVNNGETLGTISLLDQAAAGDQYAVSIQSADANMAAAAFVASGNIPGIPSIITNIKRIG